MTERNLGNSFSWWIGKVVNVNDPDKSGRVQIRAYGRHDDKINIPDDSLPWALPLQSVNSAALGKVGISPLGLLKGSRVVGIWMDEDQQYPIVLGSFGKAGDALAGSTIDGAEDVDLDTGSIPSAASPTSNADTSTPRNPYSLLNDSRVTVTDINSGAVNVDSVSRALGTINHLEVDKLLAEPNRVTLAGLNKNERFAE